MYGGITVEAVHGAAAAVEVAVFTLGGQLVVTRHGLLQGAGIDVALFGQLGQVVGTFQIACSQEVRQFFAARHDEAQAVAVDKVVIDNQIGGGQLAVFAAGNLGGTEIVIRVALVDKAFTVAQHRQ